jgi:hypothetical protein
MNFNSPYKADSIADFWRRWHMTLSRFLRDYVYIPLGGNRRGHVRRYVNLFLTMLIGGIWHGAGWTFVIWGALHGTYLLMNHAWRERAGKGAAPTLTRVVISRGATFLAVVLAWVFFRADTVKSAVSIIVSLFGVHGLTSDLARLHQSNGWALVAPLLLVVWFFPNTNQLLAKFAPTLEYFEEDAAPSSRRGSKPPVATGWWRKLEWSPSVIWVVAVVALTVASIIGFSRGSEFIYWQF